MRIVTRRMPAAACLVAASLVVLTLGTLSGCVTAPPPNSSSPVPQPTPLFATDDEALAAATKAYAAYLKMSDTIAHDGGARPERIKAVATTHLADSEIDGFEKFAHNGWRSKGTTSFDSVILQQYEKNSRDFIGFVSLYLCVDVSAVDVVDAAGKSQVSSTRPERISTVATFTRVGPMNRLLVESSEPWKDNSICG